jgi:hypothetical protein
MRFDHQKAFPYPVLRPGVDDYVAGDVQTTVKYTVKAKAKKILAEVSFGLSVKEIATQVSKRNAVYAALFSCRDTYFRDALTSTKPQFEKTFDASNFKGEVIVYPFVVATSEIKKFSCPDINKEFGTGGLQFDAGAVLAAVEPQVFYFDRDLFTPISSIVRIVQGDAEHGFEWKVRLNGDKIDIVLSQEAKKMVDRGRNTAPGRAVLINSIYFAAVTEAIQKLRDLPSEYEESRWAKVLTQQCHNLHIDLEKHDAYRIAQLLLKSPLYLMSLHLFKESV